jgi:hypothetical protein
MLLNQINGQLFSAIAAPFNNCVNSVKNKFCTISPTASGRKWTLHLSKCAHAPLETNVSLPVRVIVFIAVSLFVASDLVVWNS